MRHLIISPTLPWATDLPVQRRPRAPRMRRPAAPRLAVRLVQEPGAVTWRAYDHRRLAGEGRAATLRHAIEQGEAALGRAGQRERVGLRLVGLSGRRGTAVLPPAAHWDREESLRAAHATLRRATAGGWQPLLAGLDLAA